MMRRLLRNFAGAGIFLALSLLLAGCGGSGSSAALPQESVTASGPPVFAAGGDQELVVGTGLSNRATAPSAAAVSYASSDPRIATVGPDGRVETFLRGTVTITAKAAGAGAQSASYTLRVLPAVLNGAVVDDTQLHSLNTGIDYPYAVYLPASYGNGAARYPVMYLTDGQWMTNLYKMADRLDKKVILVLIHQGPDDRRMVDYTPPGAAAYMRFMKQELAPLIESTYRTNGDRTYYGVSAGGTLGAILLANEPVGTPFFAHYVLGDPAFQLLDDATLRQEAQRFDAGASLPVTVLMTGSTQGNLGVARALAARYAARPYVGMRMHLSEYALPHVQMSDPTFIEAMDALY